MQIHTNPYFPFIAAGSPTAPATSPRLFCVERASFPRRNKVMAALSRATVIVEAAECLRLGRPLFVTRSLVDDPRLSWPRRLLQAGAHILTSTQDVLSVVGHGVAH